jgi:excisionase family DNA binding protein
MLLTIKELSEKLNLKVSWIRHKVFWRQIPFIKAGRLIRFDPVEITKWITEQSFSNENKKNK